ncbi:MAG: hypothetical protein H7Z43_02145 [Clostridia bacterium]|nr:hypothetical protein [Deltaproteobacteria bacterium]
MKDRFAFLFANLPLKVFSLVLAAALYAFVTIESGRSVDVEFPIEYLTADDIDLIGEFPHTITVTLAGPWASIRTYDSSKFQPVRVDLRDNGPGPVLRNIQEREVNPPGGMSVVAITPNEVQVTLARKVERQVAIAVDVGIDKPPYGYEIAGTTTEPEKVRIIGPNGVVQQIDSVFTRPIEVAGHEETFTENAELRAPSPSIRLRDKSVTVTVEIREEMTTRVVTVPMDARQGALPTEVLIEPSTVKLELRGPRRLLDAFDKSSVTAYVDITSDLQDGVREVERNVIVEGLHEKIVMSPSPSSVHVKVVKLIAKRRGK